MKILILVSKSILTNPIRLADRLVNAVAARDLYDLPATILDFGMATTFDLVGRCGSYEGGIAPGVNLSVEALYLAARLPRLAVEPWEADMPILGKTRSVPCILVSFGAMSVWLRV